MKTIISFFTTVFTWMVACIARLFRKVPEQPALRITPAQLEVRQRFAEAVQFASEKIRSPVFRRFFEHRARPGRSAYLTAISMYLRYFARGVGPDQRFEIE